jgi:hypothetical protein
VAFDNRGRADLAGARSRRGALRGGRTFDFGASGTRARRTLSLGLITLGAIKEHGLRLGNRGLENIVAQIGTRGHFTF